MLWREREESRARRPFTTGAHWMAAAAADVLPPSSRRLSRFSHSRPSLSSHEKIDLPGELSSSSKHSRVMRKKSVFFFPFLLQVCPPVRDLLLYSLTDPFNAGRGPALMAHSFLVDLRVLPPWAQCAPVIILAQLMNLSGRFDGSKHFFFSFDKKKRS